MMGRLLEAEDWMWTPCRLWTGNRSSDGYGRLKVDGRRWRVHRLAWTEAYGPIPDGFYVCHHCDVRACYELEHLFLGTHQDNIADMNRKGRHRNLLKTHCPQGHPLVPGNLRVRRSGRQAGTRECLTCHRQNSRGHRSSRPGHVAEVRLFDVSPVGRTLRLGEDGKWRDTMYQPVRDDVVARCEAALTLRRVS